MVTKPTIVTPKNKNIIIFHFFVPKCRLKENFKNILWGRKYPDDVTPNLTDSIPRMLRKEHKNGGCQTMLSSATIESVFPG